MPLVQVRDVPEETVARLKARAKEKGLTMAAYIRDELEKLAERPTNAEVVAEILRNRPKPKPGKEITSEGNVAIIRALRENS
jgi:predicted DNA-binding protein